MYSKVQKAEAGTTEWQWPHSGVHSIMMVKSAQSGEGGGVRPPPFTLSLPVVVQYGPAERTDTLPLFTLWLELCCRACHSPNNFYNHFYEFLHLAHSILQVVEATTASAAEQPRGDCRRYGKIMD